MPQGQRVQCTKMCTRIRVGTANCATDILAKPRNKHAVLEVRTCPYFCVPGVKQPQARHRDIACCGHLGPLGHWVSLGEGYWFAHGREPAVLVELPLLAYSHPPLLQLRQPRQTFAVSAEYLPSITMQRAYAWGRCLCVGGGVGSSVSGVQTCCHHNGLRGLTDIDFSSSTIETSGGCADEMSNTAENGHNCTLTTIQPAGSRAKSIGLCSLK